MMIMKWNIHHSCFISGKQHVSLILLRVLLQPLPSFDVITFNARPVESDFNLKQAGMFLSDTRE